VRDRVVKLIIEQKSQRCGVRNIIIEVKYSILEPVGSDFKHLQARVCQEIIACSNMQCVGMGRVVLVKLAYIGEDFSPCTNSVMWMVCGPGWMGNPSEDSHPIKVGI